MSKPGRNDPCPCGSGKKFKHCCLSALEAPLPEDLRWRRVRRALENHTANFLRYGEERYGRAFLGEAWRDFCLGDETQSLSQDTPHMQVFMPWLFFHWMPHPDSDQIKQTGRDGLTLAQGYLRDRASRIEPALAEYLQASDVAPLSFYDVLSVRPGYGVRVRDIFEGSELEVTERAGSQHLQAGDIVFAKIARMPDLAMFEALSPVRFPPDRRSPIIRLRQRMEKHKRPIGPVELKEWELELIEVYWEMVEPILNPLPPVLQNTDGEPYLPHSVVYDIASPQVAFAALADLSIVASPEELLREGRRDAKGELVGVEFAWHKLGNAQHAGWTNTVMGKIDIDGPRLTVEVNSENRALLFRKLMEERLPEARYRTTVVQSVESALAERRRRPPTAAERKAEKEKRAVQARPEVQAMLAAEVRNHYRHWLDSEIPALGGQTPRQAVRSRDGRELVEGLLLGLERKKGDAPALDQAILLELRQELGLLKDP